MIKSRKKRLTLQNKFFIFQLSSVLIVMTYITTACFNQPSSNGSNEAPNTLAPQVSSTIDPSVQPTADDESTVQPVEEPSNDNQVKPSESHVTAPEQQDQDTPEGTSNPEPQPSASKPASDDKTEVILTKSQIAKKRSIDNKYDGKISSLRSVCKATSGQLLESMIGELSSNEDATLMTLQTKFLGKLIKAETSCDGRFQTLIEGATAEYLGADIPVSKMPAWQSQYSKEKAAVRASAIAKLVAAIK